MRYGVGMYGGSFNPLHTGHVDCIIQAANMCRELYIVLSSGKKRDEIDLRIRYRWLYQLTKHIGSVKLIIIEDDAKTKDDYNKEYWMRDAEYVKAKIGKKIDIVFCGDDYGENSFWNVCYPESELFIFPRNGVSSTRIRNDPYSNWGSIPSLVRPYYTKRVLITGVESTGKSTLTINLAQRFNAGYIDEAGRDLSERSGTDRMMIPGDFSEILLQHKLNEINEIEKGHMVLFEDTDALITQFFMEFLNDPGIAKNRVLSDAIDALNKFDLILFLEPDVEFVQDGDRSEEIMRNREKYSDQIKELLRKHGREFVSISGDYQERYLKAVKLVEKLLNGGLENDKISGCC